MKKNYSDFGNSLTFRSFGSTFDKSTSRGQYQDLLETIGVFKSESQKSLPNGLKGLKELAKKTKKNLKPEFGIPVDRRDAQMLIKWLDGMLVKIGENNGNLESVLESALNIYEVCFHEIVRQVSVHCKERGELVSRVWKAYINLLERALRISQATQQSQLLGFIQEKEQIKSSSALEMVKLQCSLTEKDLDLLKYADRVTAKEDEISKLGLINKRLVHRLEIIRSHYEGVKKEIVGLKEENRILKGKLVNTEIEFVVNDHGIIEAQHKRLKIKRKTRRKLEEIIIKDPIITLNSLIDPNVKESLGHDILNYEEELVEIFNHVDFEDKGTNTSVVAFESQETTTDLAEVCGDSIGEAKEVVKNVPSLMELLSEKIQTFEKFNEDPTELLANALISDTSPEATEQVSNFIEKMKENLGVVTNPLMTSLYASVASALKQVRSAEAKPEIKRLKTIRHKIWSVIQESRLKKNSEVTSLIIQKIKNTPQHKLRKILVKKILLKFITVFYDSKLQKRHIDLESSKKQEMAQHVLEILGNKYGPGKIAEKKFMQIAASCIKYKHIKRVKLFGRFLKLFDELDNEDLESFLDFNHYLKNSTGKEYANAEYADQNLISYEKAMDLFKSTFLSKLSDPDKKSTKLWLESNKFTDNLYKVQVVDLDAYLEFVLERNRSKKNAKSNFLHCIYEAADVISK